MNLNDLKKQITKDWAWYEKLGYWIGYKFTELIFLVKMYIKELKENARKN